MEAGDTFVLFTDCLIETKSADGKEFGIDGISQVMCDAPASEPASDIVKRIVAAHTAHRGGAPLSDDLTVVVVTVHSDVP